MCVGGGFDDDIWYFTMSAPRVKRKVKHEKCAMKKTEKLSEAESYLWIAS